MSILNLFVVIIVKIAFLISYGSSISLTILYDIYNNLYL